MSAVVLASGSALSAPPEPVTLHYEAPPECPQQSSVLERTYGLMHYRAANAVAARARITHEAGRYRLDLDVDGGRQSVVSGSCESLVQTLAVILALASDSQSKESTPTEAGRNLEATKGVQGSPEPSGAPPVPAEATPTTSPAYSPPPTSNAPSSIAKATAAPEPIRQAPVRAVTPQIKPHEAPVVSARVTEPSPRSPLNAELHVSTQLLTEYGMLRRLAEGPSVGLDLALNRWSLDASAKWLVPQWKPMPGSDPPRGGYISFLGGELDACFAQSRARLFHTCVGVEAGDMMGQGSGVSRSQLGHGLWLAATSALAFRPRLWSKVSADIRLGMAIPMKRPAFGFDNYSWRFEPYPWSIRLASGFSWL